MKQIKNLSILLFVLAFFACSSSSPENSRPVTPPEVEEKISKVTQGVTTSKPIAEAETITTETTPEPEPEKKEVEASEVKKTDTKKSVSTSEKKETPKPAPKPKPVEKKEVVINNTPPPAPKPVPPKPDKKAYVPNVDKSGQTEMVMDDPPAPQPKPEKPTAALFTHALFDALLRKHVSASGKVNYKGFKSDEATLDTYLKLLEKNPPDGFGRKKAMAYWINAYNAHTIKLILNNYPLSSIMKLDGGKPWDVKRIQIGSKKYSLNNIENDILRPKYKDARIHFAVNCAAKSCPPLLNRAWTSANLESNFEKQAKAFINNPTYNKISQDKVVISKIFEWYAVDFNNIIDYLSKYSTTKISKNAKVEYNEYNWDLNE